MNWFVFLFYWIWIFFGILSFIFVKFCVVNIDDEKPPKFKGWIILVYFSTLFLPLINIAASLTLIGFCLDEGYIKDSIVDWFKNLCIIRILNKEY